MDETQEFQQKIAGTEALIGKLERAGDPAVRAAARELVQTLLDVHRLGLDRILERIVQSGDPGILLFDSLKRDPLVGSLLILHGLHPDDLDTRVNAAIVKLHASVGAMGAAIETVSFIGGALRLQVRKRSASNLTALTPKAAAIRAEIEEKVFAMAPDIASLVIDGLDEVEPNGFVPLDKLGGVQTPLQLVGMEEAAG